jgi:hypothetical protein
MGRGEVPAVTGPFPRGLPPNHAGAFQRTWLQGDLRRAVGRVPVDGVVAGAADREGLAPHLCHFRCTGAAAREGEGGWRPSGRGRASPALAVPNSA